MSIDATIDCQSVAWNSLTWDATGDGGALRVRYVHESTSVKDRTGNSVYPTGVFTVDGDCTVYVTIREVKQAGTAILGTKDDLVATFSTASGTSVLTFADMKLETVNGDQDRAVLGEAEYVFVHESDDGTTSPIS